MQVYTINKDHCSGLREKKTPHESVSQMVTHLKKKSFGLSRSESLTLL